MAQKAMGLSEFLGHKPSSGGGGQYLKNWKKRDDKSVNTVLHTRAGFTALWQHQVPQIVTFTGKQDKAEHRNAWSQPWNCHEIETVLKAQYKRDRETGERKSPPCICPQCKMVEKIREMTISGQLEFTQPIFRWEGDDADKAVTLHAGGIFNAFGSDKLEKRFVDEMRKAKLSPKEGWKENCYAKCNYLFLVVDVDHVEDGIQKAIEVTLLGDKVKEAIAAQMVARGDERGNPLKHPYAIRWVHVPDESEFNKKYKAFALPELELTSDVRRLIIDEDPPSIAKDIAPGSASLLRANLEEHALVEFGQEWWDELFSAAEKTEGERGDEPEDEPEQETGKVVDAPTARASVNEDADPPPEDDNTFECDRCKAIMQMTEYTCPGCGAEYDPKTGELLPEKPKEEPKAKPRSRSQAKAEPEQEAPKETPKEKPKPAAKREGHEVGSKKGALPF